MTNNITTAEKLTPLKAIKAWCLECCGDDHPRKCVSYDCPLYGFRLGKDSTKPKRTMSEAQKQKLLQNFAKI